MKRYGVTKVLADHPEGDMNVVSECGGNSSNSCWEISLRTANVNLIVALEEKSESVRISTHICTKFQGDRGRRDISNLDRSDGPTEWQCHPESYATQREVLMLCFNETHCKSLEYKLTTALVLPEKASYKHFTAIFQHHRTSVSYSKDWFFSENSSTMNLMSRNWRYPSRSLECRAAGSTEKYPKSIPSVVFTLLVLPQCWTCL